MSCCEVGGTAPLCKDRLFIQGSGGGGGGCVRQRLSTLEQRGGPAGGIGTQLSEPEEPDLECEAEDDEYDAWEWMPESHRLSGGLTDDPVDDESEQRWTSPMTTAESPLRPGLLSCHEIKYLVVRILP